MTATVTDAAAGVLDDLDFRPSCACEMGGCPHPTDGECGSEADVIITIHLVNDCDAAQADADGNEVGPMCRRCLDCVTGVISSYIADVRAVTRRLGGYAACRTCGRPVMRVSDVIRDVRPIR